MRFGEKLKTLRADAGMSQAGLAEVSGVPVGTVREYEQSKRRPLLENAVKLSRALRVSVEVFADCVSEEEKPALKKPKKGK